MCQGQQGWNNFLMAQVSEHLRWKSVKTLAEKEMHSAFFLQQRERGLKKIYCRSHCPFHLGCQMTPDG